MPSFCRASSHPAATQSKKPASRCKPKRRRRQHECLLTGRREAKTMPQIPARRTSGRPPTGSVWEYADKDAVAEAAASGYPTTRGSGQKTEWLPAVAALRRDVEWRQFACDPTDARECRVVQFCTVLSGRMGVEPARKHTIVKYFYFCAPRRFFERPGLRTGHIQG